MKFLVSTVAGSDVGDKVRNVLSRLMSDDVMAMLNYRGRGSKNKKALVDFKLVISLIFGMCRQSSFAAYV